MRTGRLATVIVLGSIAGAPLLGRAPQPATPPPEATPQFSARGHEPGWTLQIDTDQLTLVADYGATTLRTRRPEPHKTDRGVRYAGNADGQVLIVTVVDRICEDEATGIPHPNTVEVTIDEQPLRGCGGDPAVLLRGTAWVAEDLAGTKPAPGTAVSFTFGENGRFSGVGPCTEVNGQYAVTGEGLIVSELATTGRGCPPPAMEQEQLVLGVLENARSFGFEQDGVLRLEAVDGRRLRARRKD